MNCKQVQNRILAVEDPGQPTTDLAAHLRDCAACRAWQRRFLAINQVLPLLPVPPNDGMVKLALLERIRSVPAVERAPKPRASPLSAPQPPAPVVPRTKPRESPPPAPPPPLLLEHEVPPPTNHQPAPKPMRFNLEDDLPRRKSAVGHYAARFWPAGLVAATLLIGTVAWLSLRGDRTPPVTPAPLDPLLDNLVKLNVELAKTQSPVERVKVLARVADELNQEMREIARADATGDNMQSLEEMYRRVVLTGLVDQAKLIERSQRKAVLGEIAEGLAQSLQKSEQTAKEAPEHSASALRAAADTAKEGNKRIRRLIQGALS